jgi:3-oxoadipate enol-lactonase
MPTIHINDISVYYELSGTGEPLVLIAGLGAAHSLFKLLIPSLSHQFKILAFDNRGVGGTDKPDMPYSIEMMANDTATLMERLGIANAHILGVSMGGRIAMELALQHPDKVKSLILVSTSASRNIRKLSLLIKLIKRVRANINPSYQSYDAFLRQLKASRGYDCSNRLHKIQAPTLILHGEQDKSALYQRAEEMHVGIKGSKLIPFKGGHMFFIWENKQFADAVAAFLSGLHNDHADAP